MCVYGLNSVFLSLSTDHVRMMEPYGRGCGRSPLVLSMLLGMEPKTVSMNNFRFLRWALVGMISVLWCFCLLFLSECVGAGLLV